MFHRHGRVHQRLQRPTHTSTIDVFSPPYDKEPFPPSGVARHCTRQVPSHLDGVSCDAGLRDL
eukprot:570466-Lingulodinium_polyedra.AAC.1